MQHNALAKCSGILSRTNLVFLKFSFDPFRSVGAFKQFNLFKVAKFRPFVVFHNVLWPKYKEKEILLMKILRNMFRKMQGTKKIYIQNAIKCKMLFLLFLRLSILLSLLFVWLIFMDHLKIGLKCGLWNLNLFWGIKKSFLSSIAAFKAY